MKKVFKVFIITIFIIFLSGCSGNYNLNINPDLSIDERLELTLDNDNNTYEKTLKIFEDNNIDDSKYKVTTTGDEINISYKDKYISIEDYILNSKIYNQLFYEVQYNKTKTYVDIYASENIKQKSNLNIKNGSNLTDFDLIQVNITNPFKVDITNAEMINNNTYTWSISKDNIGKKIYMNFKPTFNKFPYRPVIVGSLILILSTVYIVRTYKKYKDKQKV